MTARRTRRQALRILGATLSVAAGGLGLRALHAPPVPARWQGEALGALSAMTVWHPSPSVAERTLARLLVEVDRLDRVFSLYRPDSQIARLNRDGRIDTPSRDLVEVIRHSQDMAALSGGAFDPTIQPLWRLHAAGPPDPAALSRALALVDAGGIEARPRGVALARPGMAISLNGIAQGHVTDRITDILRNEGFDHAMIELGETRALGAAPDGQPFSVGLTRGDAPTRIGREIALADCALAVSGGHGLVFGPGRHHILDPVTGRSATDLAQVAVTAPRARWADALSTAILVAGEAAAPALLAACPGARAMLTRRDGTTVDL